MVDVLDAARRMRIALNRLAKWRVVLTGWQLGTRAKGDAEGDAVRDHREATLIQRVELTALTRVLIEKGVITATDFQNAIADEAAEMEKMLEAKFPGFRATDDGLHVDTEKAAQTTKGWRP